MSNGTLDGILGTLDVQLDVIRPLQKQGYTRFKAIVEKFIIKKVAEIEIKAMIDAKIPEDIAIG